MHDRSRDLVAKFQIRESVFGILVSASETFDFGFIFGAKLKRKFVKCFRCSSLLFIFFGFDWFQWDFGAGLTCCQNCARRQMRSFLNSQSIDCMVCMSISADGGMEAVADGCMRSWSWSAIAGVLVIKAVLTASRITARTSLHQKSKKT